MKAIRAPAAYFSAYRFVSLPQPEDWRVPILSRSRELGLRGTILLAPEGINVFIAGNCTATAALIDWLRSDPIFEGRLANLQGQTSLCATPPFHHLRVKVKKEIITLRAPAGLIQPEQGRAPSVGASTLKKWLDQGHDDTGRELALLDTRNAFEVDVGSFDGALDYRLKQFSDFPRVISTVRADFSDKTVVSFCTGGIRCEKAVLYMQTLGIPHAYQLDGGILNYFATVGRAHYHGHCFVFDHRISLSACVKSTAD
jgi:UPF0176 protein